MATNLDYINYVIAQIDQFSNVRYRKMFGEYMVYVNDKPILLVCDNTVFVKKLDELSHLLADAECSIPYSGAKEHYVLNIDDSELVNKVIQILERCTKLPIKKNKKK